MPRSQFGARLKRVFDGATNQEIADKLGVTAPAVQNYVSGRIPDGEKLQRISAVTNCNLHWLLTGEGDPFPEKPVSSDETENDDIFENLEIEIKKTDDPIFLKKRLELIMSELDVRIKSDELKRYERGEPERDLQELRGLHFDDGTGRYRVEETDEELSEKELFLLRELEKERRIMAKPLHPRARTFDDERAEKK
ncbi:MAG: helix-turn-helix domain-containing protein [Pyrinomonadaceae bacterium]|nr:helix-turn-helix domain-containing protein [Pyrinomonadaceae bacterium]